MASCQANGRWIPRVVCRPATDSYLLSLQSVTIRVNQWLKVFCLYLQTIPQTAIIGFSGIGGTTWTFFGLYWRSSALPC